MARRIAAAAGGPVRILSGDEEAALTYHALGLRCPWANAACSGSTWVGAAWSWPSAPARTWSGPAAWTSGPPALWGASCAPTPPSDGERTALAEQVDAELGALLAPGAWPDRCVAAGGTVKAIARTLIASGDAGPGVGPLHGLRLDVADIEALSARMLTLDSRALLALPGIDRHRAGTLGTGALVIARLARHLGLAGITVSEWGLREGLILDALHLAELADVGMPELVLTG